MNSRQRLLRALRRESTDRVPISTYELVGYNSASFENQDPSYRSLMDAIRRDTDCICMWNPASSARFLESAYPVDISTEEWREENVTVRRSTLHLPAGGTLTQTNKVVDGVQTVWQTEHWCKSPEDVDRALAVPFEPASFDFFDLQRVHAELGDHGIVMATVGDPLLLAADLMEFGEYTMWACLESEHFARTVEALSERVMENLRRMLDAGVVDLYRIVGPEYATPPFLPPEYFERFVLPYVSGMVELIHSRGALVRLHSHGRIGQVLDMILDTGADGLDPCEAPPDGDIELSEVKRRAGGRLCLFGNIQLKLLESGTPEEVSRAVAACMDAAKEGGGYVLMPTAAPINTPLAAKTRDNYLRYIETARELGSYE